MDRTRILDLIAGGRTDLVFDLLRLPDWRSVLAEGSEKVLQWFVYYDDVTALKAVLEAGGDLATLDLDVELGHAAFFGHWKVCDFLIAHGANVNATVADTGETPLHGALSKAGRPHYEYVVRLLLAHGADPNARTIPGRETGAFMRDVRTRGETPLHRAAAYADATTIAALLQAGADREARDANGDSPLTWASEHLRPGEVLALLAFGPHTISDRTRRAITSDHGAGWGNGMERNLLGEFLPESIRREPG
jgi:ankyrin repeat protein